MTNFSGKNLNVACDGPKGGGMDSRRNALEQVVPKGYKQTDVGIVPVEWSEKSFGDICVVNQGLQIPIEQRKKRQTDGSKVYITIQSLSSSDEPEFIETYSPSVCCNESDILMTRTGNTGIVVHGVNGVFHNNFFKLKFDRKKISDLFLVYYLRSNRCQKTILDKAGTSTIPDLNHGDFYSIRLALPEYKEQTAIANALSDLDALLTELEKLIAKKQAIKTATMQQLLTGKTRLPQFATYTEGEKQGQPKGTKPSELGEIPEDWDVVTLNDIAEKIMVGIASAATHAYRDRGIAFLRNQNILPNKLDEKDTLFISPEYEVAFQNKRLKTGDLLTARTGYPGTTCIVPEQFNGAQSFTTLITRLKKSISNPMYVSSYMNSEAGEKFFELNQIGGGQKNVNSAILKTLPLPFPCIKEQTAITTILSDMDNEIQTLEQRLAKTRQIKQGMMQELLTGRTRLPFDREAQQGN